MSNWALQSAYVNNNNMQQINISSTGVLTAGLLCLGSLSGCGLLSIDINDQRATVTFDIRSDMAGEYVGTHDIRPNDLKEIQDNADRIDGGQIEKIYLKILSAGPGNSATLGETSGRVALLSDDFPDSDDWNVMNFSLEPITDPDSLGTEIPLDTVKIDRITGLLFPDGGGINDVKVRIRLSADGATDLRARLTVQFSATAEAL